MKELLFKDETYRIRGACYEVYKEKRCGFVEPVYQECMELELSLQRRQIRRSTTLAIGIQRAASEIRVCP